MNQWPGWRLTIMRTTKPLNIMMKLSLFLLLSVLSVVSFAAEENLDWFLGTDSVAQPLASLMLAESDSQDASPEDPRSGTLVLPVAADEEAEEKKCMTVCQRWGEDCMMDSRRGVRKCRRICKEFGQECF
jgi:hypothetical protein